MDLLYVVGTGSKHNNIELKYSLRSIEKNCTGYDRIFIAGYKPQFLNDNVIYVPFEDKTNVYKHWNILNGIKTVVDTTDISEYFVLQSDDHFYVRPYNFEEMPLYYKTELISEVPKACGNPRYKTAIVETRRLLERHGLSTLNTSSHCGTLFNKTLFKFMEDNILAEAFSSPWAAEPTCLMQAVMQKSLGMVPVYRRDCKVKEFPNEKALLEKIADNFCFSISDRAFTTGIDKYLEKWFPEKSKYEK